jgi:N-ethylmaleimide reductase
MYTDQEGPQPLPTPVAMTLDDIRTAQDEFVKAAKNARAAGFDGVELHGANGYLLEQFLRPNSNVRTDEYGGGIEKRARFVLEVAEQVGRAIGFDRLGMRLSPFGVFNDMPLYDAMESDYTYVTKKLGELGLLYVHIVDHSSMGAPEVPASMKASMRKVFPGAVILSGGYDPVRAQADLDADKGDLVAVAKAFLANPDLPERWEKGAALNEPDMDTFYTPGAKGYTDYPAM